MRKQHGVIVVLCFDHPRGYYYDAFYFGKFLGSFDYFEEASNEVRKAEK